MKRSISDKNKAYFLGLVFLLLVWQILALWIGEEKMVFPGPFVTLEQALILLKKEYTYRCILATLGNMLKGFAIALAGGLFFGIVSGNYPFFRRFFSPFITSLRAIPTASLVYLFIVLAGFKKAPLIMVILISYPIIYEGVTGGIVNLDRNIIDASKIDGSSFFQDNFYIRLPLAMPFIMAALASSFSLCFKIEVMAEVITGASIPGLGSAIAGVRSADPTNMVPVFAYSLIAIMIMLAIDFVSMLIREKIIAD